ncbi:DUF3987 domain-containing protein [Pseudonocardia sp. McavD-2-B]|uniref:DUF3987 domain-containing protein n=1 Tax=Pseudonocardia sp. McavD-2-B TaxID=2954499 RepID=UPI002098650C|nr:DUF3987 domain-containing protein [Pseudonocardia sp. McavD-2-B]MCO7193959.1 DUF3987 domain-containing protein [Pseudonocardia sp. McavD-2-B]
MNDSPFVTFQDAMQAAGMRTKVYGDRLDGQCPAHDDTAPSLSVRYDDAAGKVLLNCHAGCSSDDVLAALGLSWADLYADQVDEPAPARPTVVATYQYRAEDGALLYEKQRLHPKSFRQRRPNGGGGHEYRLGDVRRVLYRTPELPQAIEEGRPILLVEGEKDADRVVRDLSMRATCNTEGAAKEGQRTKWRREYTEQLRGAKVLVVADRDEAGYAHARAVLAELQNVAESVAAFTVSPDFKGADMSDHLDAGHGIEDLIPLPPPATNYESNEGNEGTKKTREGAPTLHPAALHGVLGDVVRRLDPFTEAAPAAILFHLLSFSSALLGPDPHILVGGSQHPARIWSLVVGPTAAGRKGESRAQALRFVTSSSSFDSYFVEQASGLSTGEGLLHRLQAEDSTGTRMVVTEAEFGRTLAASKREGNTISHVLRDLWDNGQAATMTKGDPIAVDGAHLAVIGHVTPRELRIKLTEIDVAGGLANRFLYCWSHRTKLLPDQQEPPDLTVLANQFHNAIGWARQLGQTRVRRSKAADAYWRDVYLRINSQEPEGVIGELVARASAYVLRIALAFALLDRSAVIKVPHLRAALACVAYSIRSAQHVFGANSAPGDLGKLSNALEAAGEQGLTRTEMSKLFARNKSADQINALVAELVDAGQAYETEEKQEGSRGRPTVRTIWQPTTEPEADLEDLLDRFPEGSAEGCEEGGSQSATPFAPFVLPSDGPHCLSCGRAVPEGADECARCYSGGRVA